jgi:hypothetical protein
MSYKCPYCEKTYEKIWQVENHIRASSGDHGKKRGFPDGYTKETIKEVSKESPEVSETQDKENETSPEGLETVQKVDPPEIPIVKENVCPDCGCPKTEWVSVKIAHQHDINLSKDEIAEFDYVCPKCYELIKVK